MSYHNLSQGVVFHRVKVDGANFELAAGSLGAITSDAIDTLGFDTACFVYVPGVISATGTLATKIQHSTDNGVADAFADVAGTANNFVAADSTKTRVTDVFRPTKRYLRVVSTQATANVQYDGILCLLWRAGQEVVTQDATCANAKQVSTPAAGTP